jgi:hypothetical protein
MQRFEQTFVHLAEKNKVSSNSCKLAICFSLIIGIFFIGVNLCGGKASYEGHLSAVSIVVQEERIPSQ